MRYLNYLGLWLPLALGACATGGTNDGKVNIVSASNGHEFAGANCVVNTNSQTWHIVTPTTLTIGSANGDLHIVCNKIGFRTSELIQPPYASGQSGSSVGFGMGGGSGNVGVGLGFSLPISRSGGYYPARVMVNMNPQ